ncbi:unnamed protein product [Prunus armeniaca]
MLFQLKPNTLKFEKLAKDPGIGLEILFLLKSNTLRFEKLAKDPGIGPEIVLLLRSRPTTCPSLVQVTPTQEQQSVLEFQDMSEEGRRILKQRRNK